MDVIWGAVISAGVLLVIPIVGWFSRRITKEGRLTLRVGRMGLIYSAMPPSPERATYEQHYRRVIAELNEWLDVDARALRKAVRGVFAITYIAGAVVVATASRVLPPDNEVQSVVVGALIGVGVLTVSFGGQYLLERRASRKHIAARRAEKEKAFKQGESMTKDG